MEESVHAGGWIGKPRGGKEKSSMNPRFDSSRFVAALAALIFVATACGSTGSGTPSASKGTLTVAGFNFPESSILAEIYGQALAHDGYTINYKLLLGNREVVAPALESGQIDLYPGYAATDLEYYNKSAGEANGDATATTAKLNSHLQPLGLTALTPSAALLPARPQDDLRNHLQGVQAARHRRAPDARRLQERKHRRRPGFQQRRRPQLAGPGRAAGRQAPRERGQRGADPAPGCGERRGHQCAQRHRRQADHRGPVDHELTGLASAPGRRRGCDGLAAAAQLQQLKLGGLQRFLGLLAGDPDRVGGRPRYQQAGCDERRGVKRVG